MERVVTPYLDLKNIKGFELLLALYPLLGQYVYGSLHLELLLLLVLDIIALSKHKGFLKCRPLNWFSAIVLVHEIVVFIITGANNQTHLNNILSIMIFIGSLYIIAPAINYKRLSSAINLVSIICMLGLVYHFLMIQTGHTITPIQILPNPGSASRLNEAGYRPVSFFWEPAGYISYMMVPLFMSLIERKFLWSAIIMFTILLSTSTNGIVFSFIIIAGYVMTQKISNKIKIGVVIIGVLFAYFLFNSSLFESGVEKINETEYEHTSRLYNGPTMVSNMPTEHLIWGIPRFNAYDYYAHTSYMGGTMLLEKHDEIFLPSVYLIIVKYGVVALVFYIWMLLYIVVKCRKIRPYLLVLVVGMFSQSTLLNMGWTYYYIFVFCFIAYDMSQQSIESIIIRKNKALKDENTYANNAIC